MVPVVVEFDGTFFRVGGAGSSVLATRTFRNVAAGGERVAPVFDDLVSFEPFVARGVRVYDVAEGPVEQVGMVGPGVFRRITPIVSWSWNTAGEPVGESWYPARKVVHAAPRLSGGVGARPVYPGTTTAHGGGEHPLTWAFAVERMTGIEPAYSAWEPA